MIHIDIVTPSKKILEGAETTEVRIPTESGQITVLPGHTELLTILGTGKLSFPQDGTERRFAVSYGFAEIRNDRILVLAETAEESKDIDLERAKRAQKKAQGELENVLNDDHFKKYQFKLQRALVRQEIA